jgi:hypothetical protein
MKEVLPATATFFVYCRKCFHANLTGKKGADPWEKPVNALHLKS